MLGDERPVFLFDLAAPECWVAAERVNSALAEVPVWEPVRGSALAAAAGDGGAPSREARAAAVARHAAAEGLPAPRLPPGWPVDDELALRAATYAKAGGRAVAFSLAALRQAFAAGRDLSVVDNVLIAAAACELHPRAVLKALETRAVARALAEATEAARAAGAGRVPAIAFRGRVFDGDDAIEQAAGAVAAEAR